MYFRKPSYGDSAPIQLDYVSFVSFNSFAENQLEYKQTKFSVSSRLWNKLLDQQQKSLDRKTSFKKSIKLTLITKTKINSFENESTESLLRVYFI